MKDSPVWYLRLAEKIKEGYIHAFNKNRTKQDHYDPLTIILIRGTPPPSKFHDRHIDNTPAWKKIKYNNLKEDMKPNDSPLFFIGSHIYSYNGTTIPCHILLTIDNNLSSINICSESTQNHTKFYLASHIDSCATMNVVNIRIHQWLVTTHP